MGWSLVVRQHHGLLLFHWAPDQSDSASLWRRRASRFAQLALLVEKVPDFHLSFRGPEALELAQLR